MGRTFIVLLALLLTAACTTKSQTVTQKTGAEVEQQAKQEDLKKLEPVFVTGSRIKRAPVLVGKSTLVYGPARVRIINRADIDETSATDIPTIVEKRGN